MKSDPGTRDCEPPGDASIADLERGATARVTRIAGSRSVSQRMRMLGIRPGVDVRVLHGPDRRGAVLGVGGARIALGRAVLSTVRVAPLEPGTEAAERAR
ncbi:MAG TPA: FeoA family protein [Trueperaceae bacterium]|nr:FeoA family protein [Trueperaceae bacterium]